MKIHGLILFVVLLKVSAGDDEKHALFFHTGSLDPVDHFSSDLDDSEARQIRQTEFTVRSILEWLQGRYTQPSRKIQRSSNRHEASASQPSRQYLPVPEQPTKEHPRPFQPSPTVPPTLPPSTPPQPPSITYYPSQPSRPSTHRPPTPSYPQPVPPSTQYPFPPSAPPTGYPESHPPYPPFPPSPELETERQPPQTTLQPPGEAPYPPVSTPQPPRIPQPPQQPYPQPPQPQPPQPPQQPYPQPPQPYPPQPQPPQPQPPQPPQQPYPQPPQPHPPQPQPPQPQPPQPSQPQQPHLPQPQPPQPQPSQPPFPVSTPGIIPGGGDQQVVPGTETNDIEGVHPPHIHSIEVQCAKDQMTINLEFNRAFYGVIYSKGFYKDDTCRYVNEGSGQIRYSFTLHLDACGSQFIDQFKEGGQAYLENVLVIQNEPGIQEVWDTIRRVRCLWEGNIRESLSVSLAVGMLNQEIVTFSGDTAIARLNIQMGRGPFAPAATGLVKIGETMTLVVSVEGDPAFDIQVRDCVARDVSSINVLKLTDERGCVLRPKLIGAFQKTRDTGASGTSIIAYAFFQAFKFPDVMDLTLECNVELCKTECDSCPEQGQNIDPARRRRRDLWVNNSTLGDPVRVFRTFRVVTPDDLDEAVGASTIVNVGSDVEGVCMSLPGFLLAVIFLLSVLVGSCLLCTYFWLKLQRRTKSFQAAKTVHLETFPISKA